MRTGSKIVEEYEHQDAGWEEDENYVSLEELIDVAIRDAYTEGWDAHKIFVEKHEEKEDVIVNSEAGLTFQQLTRLLCDSE